MHRNMTAQFRASSADSIAAAIDWHGLCAWVHMTPPSPNDPRRIVVTGDAYTVQTIIGAIAYEGSLISCLREDC